MTSTASNTQITSGASKTRACRFFNTKGGCRAGDSCPYKHEVASTKAAATKSRPERQYQASVDTSRVVQKPQPQTQDVRTFQLGQIKRRFNPEHTEGQSDIFHFSMTPSDPDFPYEIDALRCSLEVPARYPEERPSLKILNKEIPRGFQINIERGFDVISSQNSTATLLGLMNRLDRQLESILAGDMVETIKIVAHRPAKTQPTPPAAVTKPIVDVPQTPVYTAEDRSKATIQRQADTRQLEARFGRVPAFQKSSDGLRYTLPLESPKKSTWPPSLQNIRIFTIIVPDLYPLETASLVLDSDSDEARNVEEAFSKRASDSGTLTQAINYLTINLKDMAQAEVVKFVSQTTSVPMEVPAAVNTTQLDDRPHLHVIPRPPEWNIENGQDDSETDEDSYDSGDDTEGTAGSEEQVYATAPIERGILLSFPNLELHGIELMEVSALGITIKCDRCKDTMDITNLRSTTPESTNVRSESCKKCASGLGIGFRADLIHTNSVRAGYLDLDACTIVDMLPSSFLPTCAECSNPAPSIVSVRGESTMAICRECHKKMTFRIPEVKFLHISAANMRASRAPARKKKEQLGIVAGTELPRRGRCTHYAKSYRWFRFSCCNKVFACDRCHDEAENHPNEHANRMLCGYCSREQNYRPEDCGICHAVLIGRRGHGFWEGGKGTRDKARMSRKDPRKYKRIGTSKKT